MKRYTRNVLAVATAAALSMGTVAAPASEKGDLIVRVGGALVAPANVGSTDIKVTGIGDTGSEAIPDNAWSLGLTVTYMFSKNWGLGLLGAYPFSHDIEAKGGALGSGGLGLGKVADTKTLPPTLTLQYHPTLTDSTVQPYLGVGLNYTYFFDENVTDPTVKSLGTTDMDLDNSWGIALEAGMDIEIDKHWSFNTALWYIDIDTTASFNGPVQNIEVDIDPLVWFAGVGYKF